MQWEYCFSKKCSLVPVRCGREREKELLCKGKKGFLKSYYHYFKNKNFGVAKQEYLFQFVKQLMILSLSTVH